MTTRGGNRLRADAGSGGTRSARGPSQPRFLLQPLACCGQQGF